jgi:DNA-binding Lrp family transcriptional regulator
MRNNVAIKILQQLLKNSKKSDRELAKIVGISQATFTRRRKQLERKIIQEYTITPNLYELGFEILAFTFVRSVPPTSKEGWEELVKKGRESMVRYPNVIFSSKGEGLGMSSVVVSVHEDYTSYSDFLSQLRQEWANVIVDTQNFLVSLKGDYMAKSFSFKYLADILPKVVQKQL